MWHYLFPVILSGIYPHCGPPSQNPERLAYDHSRANQNLNKCLGSSGQNTEQLMKNIWQETNEESLSFRVTRASYSEAQKAESQLKLSVKKTKASHYAAMHPPLLFENQFLTKVVQPQRLHSQHLSR